MGLKCKFKDSGNPQENTRCGECDGYGMISFVKEVEGYSWPLEFMDKCRVYFGDREQIALKRELANSGRDRDKVLSFEDIEKEIPALKKQAERVRSILTRKENLFYLCSPNGTGKTTIMLALILFAGKKRIPATYITAKDLRDLFRMRVAGEREEREVATFRIHEILKKTVIAIDDIDRVKITENFIENIEPILDAKGGKKIVLAGNAPKEKADIAQNVWIRDRLNSAKTLTWYGESHRKL